MSTGLAKPACGGRNARSAASVCGRQLGKRQPVRLAGVGEQDAGAAGVGHHADAWPGGHRLRGEQRRHVEELLQRAGADDPRLLEQRVDGDVEARERRRVARRGARARGGAPRLDGDDRLAARDLRGDARELARVPEALEVEHDHLRCAGRRPSSRGDRCSTRRPCCRPRRTSRCRCRARGRSRGRRGRARRSARACRRCPPAARSARRSR